MGVCPAADCTMPLNPSTNATFELIEDILEFMTAGKRGSGIFPDNMFHLGGDEVNTECWTKSPEISSWLTDQGLSADGGYEYFVKRAQGIAKKMGRDPVGWNEIWSHFGPDLDKNAIIHFW